MSVRHGGLLGMLRRLRAPRTEGALDGVPSGMPALLRADTLSQHAARVGFDFEHFGQSADKVAEELAEVRAAAATATSAGSAGWAAWSGRAAPTASPETFEEVGDLLFAAANLARKLGVDPELALRAANAKFERRFRAMEARARERGEHFAALDLAAQERLWRDVKRAE